MKKIVSFVAGIMLAFGAVAQGFDWHNPLKDAPRGITNVHNQAWNEDGGNYRRLPARAEKNVRPALWNLSTNSAGLQLRFVTDSRTIAVRYGVTGCIAMPHMPATGVSGVDLYRNSDNAFCYGIYSFGDNKVEYEYYVDRPAGRRNEEYTLYLPLYNEVKNLEIGVEKGSSFHFVPAGNEKPVVVYGTSIAQGACASRPAMAWTNILQRETGIPVVNLGFSGNGKLEPAMIDLINEIDSRAVVLDCMANLFQLPQAELTAHVENAVMQIRSKSDVPILLVEHAGNSNINSNQGKYDSVINANTAQSAAYNNLVSKGVKNLYYLSRSEINMPADAWVDYVHPTDLGQQHHARAVARALGRFLPEARNSVAPHVVLIGLDGWGAYSLPKADMPTVKEFMKSGCYTLEKRTVLPSSSAPNWASMFMGAPTEIHGYTQWGSKTPEIPERVVGKHGIFPTVFQLLRDADPNAEIGVLYEWDGIKYLVDTLSLSYHQQALTQVEGTDSQITDLAVKYIREKKPELLAVCFDEPDHVGHTVGHDTPGYYDKLHELDGYIARIVQAVKDAGIYDDTVFIITSDHGGINMGHGGITLAEMNSPFIISGKGIKATGEFSEVMMQPDVSPTIARILGIEQPQAWTGRPMLQVFE